jgi:hypothetical protein
LPDQQLLPRRSKLTVRGTSASGVNFLDHGRDGFVRNRVSLLAGAPVPSTPCTPNGPCGQSP